MRKVSVSEETLKFLLSGKKIEDISFLPVDLPNCDCRGIVKDWEDRMAKIPPIQRKVFQKNMGIIDCPKAKNKRYKKYKITCSKCKSIIAYIHATNEKLEDWCNLHYVCEAVLYEEDRTVTVPIKSGKNKGKVRNKKVKQTLGKWKGCMTVNISPRDSKLGFECTCGNDTRDFRTCAILNKENMRKKKDNLVGREFGVKNSKYILEEING